MKPWREVIVPHVDVLNGTFQQSEFAADLTAVRSGKATVEYGDAKAFYERGENYDDFIQTGSNSGDKNEEEECKRMKWEAEFQVLLEAIEMHVSMVGPSLTQILCKYHNSVLLPAKLGDACL